MNSEAARRDSGQFLHFKNKTLKAYRDAGHSFVEDDSTFGDSGYTSVHTTTLSHLDPKHALVNTLQTIDESVESEAALMTTPSTSDAKKMPKPEIITPTSQSIQQILALHLTTPTDDVPPEEMGAAAAMEMSPVKRQHAAELFEPKTPPELLLSAHEMRTANSTPRKTKMVGRKRSLRDETDSENNGKRACPGLKEEEPGISRMPFSPIHNQRFLKERSISDNNLLIRCSTPKEAMIRRRFFAETKTTAVDVPKTPEKTPPKVKQTLRRFQSFSPGKLKLQRHKTDLFHPYKKNSSSGGDKCLPGTSRQSPRAQKILMGNISEEIDELPSPEEVRRVAPQAHASLMIEDASAYDSFDFGRAAGKSISPIKPSLEQLLHAKILPESQDTNVTLELSTSFQLSFQTDDIPVPVSKSPTPSCSTAMVEVSEKLPSPSPTKRYRNMYRDLPKTPTKDPKKWREPNPDRSTPLKNRTVFFDGCRFIDFVKHLGNSAPQIIEQIFQNLGNEDVLRAYAVSSVWKKAIDENKFLSKRRLDYIKHSKRPNKENITFNSPEPKPQQHRQPFAVHNYDTRSAARANAALNQSPPVSPNKSRFRANQKIIRKLSPRAMTKCPHCGRPSPIITQKGRDHVVRIGRSTRSSAKKAELRKTVSDTSAGQQRYAHHDDTFIFPLDSSSTDSSGNSGNASGSGSERKIRRTLFPSTTCRKTEKRSSIDTSSLCSSNRSSLLSVYSYSIDGSPQMTMPLDGSYVEEYGLCSGRSCGFKFCVKCLAEFHPGTMCRNSMELYSPGREEDSIQNRSNKIGSKQSRRTLRRL